MHVAVNPHPHATVLAASGRIDQSSAEDFLAALQQQVESCNVAMPLVIDFSGVDYISSVGLRALMMVARQIKARQGRLGIAALQPLVREVFGIARFDLVIPCFDNVDGAIAGLSA